MAYEVELRRIEPQPTASIRDMVARKAIDDRLAQLIPAVQDYLDEQGLQAAGRPYARLHNFGEVKRVNVDLEVGIPVAEEIEGNDEIVPGKLPGCQAAVTTYRGPYDEISEAYNALGDWIEGREYEADGAPWESYQGDLEGIAEREEWQVEIVWPVRAT